MKDKLAGVLVGVAACIGLVAVSGFSSSSEQNQDHHHGRYQLVSSSEFDRNGNRREAHMYLLDTEAGHVWERNPVRDYRDRAVAGRIDKEDYPSNELFVKIYVD